MTDPSDSVDPVAEILARWKARPQGDAPQSLDDLCIANPDFADEIRTRAAALEALGQELGRESDAPPAHLHAVRSERYARFRPAGEGGMGIVYWAIDSDLNREVAFKVVRPGTPSAAGGTSPLEITPPVKGTPASAAFATLKARFLQEAWVTAGMSHPGIVPVYELGETPQGVPYYTMRFVRGNRTLAHAIEETKGRPWEERIPLLEAFLKVCDTLSYAHAQGVVHRDVKPDNVALGEFGEVVVLDWGLAKIKDRPDVVGDVWRERIQEFRATADLRTLASALGTPGYMSPEAALGRVAEVDARSDVYSLGAILYRILTGRLPFEFETFVELIRKLMQGAPAAPAEVEPGVPDELSRLCLRALARNREARPKSADAFAAEIRSWQTRRTLDREADALVRDAQGALDAASALTGAAAAGEIDRAASIVARAVSLRPEDAATRALSGEIARRREATMAERERAARRRTVRRAATVTLAVGAVAAVVVAALLDKERRETTEARDIARLERDAKTAALGAERTARAEADASQRRAKALALAHASSEPLATSPQTSLLLARESVRVEALPEGISRLHDALAASKERLRFLRDPLEPEKLGMRAAAFVGGGTHVVGSDRLNELLLWKADGTFVGKVPGPKRMLVRIVATADGARFLGYGRGGDVRVYAADGAAVGVLPGHAEIVTSAVFDRTGSRVLSADSERARLFESGGRLIATVGDATHKPIIVDLSPDGRRFATGTRDGMLGIWDESGARIALVRASAAAQDSELTGVQSGINTLCYAPDGSSVVTAGFDGNVALWSADGKPLFSFQVYVGPLNAGQDCGASFSPDGTRILAWGSDAALETRDLAGRQIWREPVDNSRRAIRWTNPLRAVWSPDGSRIAATLMSGEIRVLAADGKRLAVLKGNANNASSLEFSKDSRRILSTAPTSGGAILWDADGGEDVHLPRESGELLYTRFSDDGRWLVLARRDGTVVIRNLDTGAVTSAAVPAGETPRAFWTIALSLDGSRVVTVSDSAPPRVHTLAGGPSVPLRGHEGKVFDAAISPDGTLVATAGADRTARLWRIDGTSVAVLGGASAELSRVTFSRDGKLVATGMRDGEVRVFDLTGRVVSSWTELDQEVSALTFSPDGRSLAACSFRTASVCVFEVGGKVRWEKHRITRGPSGQLSDLGWAPDGKHLLTMNKGGATRVWTAAGEVRAVLRGDDTGLSRAAFSPDGTLVATATDAAQVLLWDLDGRQLMSVRNADSLAADVVFSADGRLLVTAWRDGSADRWFVRTEDLMRVAAERATRPFTRSEAARYETLLGDDDRRRLHAQRLADDARERLPLAAEVIEDITAKPGVDEDVRRAAIAIAGAIPDDPQTLNSLAWGVVADPSSSAARIASATRWAEAAVVISPSGAYELAALGACHYRAGRFDKALEVLRLADACSHTDAGKGVVDASEFLAMVCAARGDVAEAERWLADARALAAGFSRTAASTKALIAEAALRVEEARSKK